MIDATVLIPTHRHAPLVPWAVRSALDQVGATVEVFVVGDGVEDETRESLGPLLEDARVRFFDFSKGARHGEELRHAALQEASGLIVCNLSDDDLLLPRHVRTMSRLLEDADFAHGPPAWLDPDGTLHYFPWNLGRAEFVEAARGRRASIGLTGSAHTLAAYRRLPHGWRTTPVEYPTDHWMWLQWLDLPSFRAAVSRELTHLWFPDPLWGSLEADERERKLARWFGRSREPGFAEELDAMLGAAVVRAAEDYHLWARQEEHAAASLRATRTWRTRELLLRLGPLRTLLARTRGAR